MEMPFSRAFQIMTARKHSLYYINMQRTLNWVMGQNLRINFFFFFSYKIYKLFLFSAHTSCVGEKGGSKCQLCTGSLTGHLNMLSGCPLHRLSCRSVLRFCGDRDRGWRREQRMRAMWHTSCVRALCAGLRLLHLWNEDTTVLCSTLCFWKARWAALECKWNNMEIQWDNMK